MPIYKMQGSKNGKQKYRVRINYTDAYGKAKQIDRVTYGSAEAKELERMLSHELKNQQPIKNITINDLHKEYIKSKQGEVRATTIEKNKFVYKHHIEPYIGDISLSKLTIPVLSQWKSTINEKTIDDKRESKLQLKSKQNIYGELRALLNYAVKMDYISQNPLLKIGNFKDTSVIKKEMLYYTPEEFSKFIKCAYECAENAPSYAEWEFYVSLT